MASNLTGQTAVVTGGNSGIGLETCRVLARAGASVVMCARSKELGEAAVEQIRSLVPGAKVALQLLDLADLVQVQAAAASLLQSHPRLDMLICNAGVMALPQLQRTTQGFEMQSGVNWLGHVHLVNLLLPRIKEQKTPSRIVLVSSMAHKMGGFDIRDLNWERRRYSAWGAYGQSKVAMILYGRQLAKTLEGTPVRIFSLHPGCIETNLWRHIQGWGPGGWGLRCFFAVAKWLPNPLLASKTIPQGAATQVFAATAPELSAFNGEYLDDCSIASTTKTASDIDLAGQLWKQGEELIQKALQHGN